VPKDEGVLCGGDPPGSLRVVLGIRERRIRADDAGENRPLQGANGFGVNRLAGGSVPRNDQRPEVVSFDPIGLEKPPDWRSEGLGHKVRFVLDERLAILIEHERCRKRMAATVRKLSELDAERRAIGGLCKWLAMPGRYRPAGFRDRSLGLRKPSGDLYSLGDLLAAMEAALNSPIPELESKETAE
jgi:hypothetical protein